MWCEHFKSNSMTVANISLHCSSIQDLLCPQTSRFTSNLVFFEGLKEKQQPSDIYMEYLFPTTAPCTASAFESKSWWALLCLVVKPEGV